VFRSSGLRGVFAAGAILTVALLGAFAQTAQANKPPPSGVPGGNTEGYQSGPEQSEGGQSAPSSQPGNPNPGVHDNGRGGNTYVNDPCLDPAPSADAAVSPRRGVTQSETEMAAFGNYMVAGYNDSLGFYDSREGLSGYAYSVNGGNTWIDGGGLPPRAVKAGPEYFGDPVLVVDKSARTFGTGAAAVSQAPGQFYYASIYVNEAGEQTLSVNRGRFVSTPPPAGPATAVESRSDTRCANDPALRQTPNTKSLPNERIVWEPPVEAVRGLAATCVVVPVPGTDPPEFETVCDELDKEWLTVNPKTGALYMTYTRFGADGGTPIEMVRSYDGGRTWTAPSVIVPNLADTFNQATQPIVTATGRIVVTWISRTFSLVTGSETSNRIEYAFSDTDGATFGPAGTIAVVNPQGEPNGYNRRRRTILNAPYINTDPATGLLYVTYFHGKTPLATPDGGVFTGRLAKAADILISRSTTNGTTWDAPVKVNDDAGTTTHVFPTVQINKHHDVYVGWLDRRDDPANVFTNLWANVSKDDGATYGHDKVQTDIATTWYVRTDSAPNLGDYNSSELLNDNQFLLIWADGRFMPPFCTGTEPFCFTLPGGAGGVTRNRPATADTIFTISQGLGVGGG